jgi:hypothetical protein
LSKSQDCHVLPEVPYVHAGQVRFCGQDCSNGTTGIHLHLRKSTTKRTKVECPLSYLSTTSMGITRIEDKQKRPGKNIYPLVWSGMSLQYGNASLILILLSHLLRIACQVTMLLFFVPLLGSSNTRANIIITRSSWHCHN